MGLIEVEGVAVVDEGPEGREGGLVAVHGEYGLGDPHVESSRPGGEARRRATMGEDAGAGGRQTQTVDEAGVSETIAEHGVVLAKKSGEDAHVGLETARKQDRVFGGGQVGKTFFGGTQLRPITVDQAGSAGAGGNGRGRRVVQSGVGRETEIVVAAQTYDVAAGEVVRHRSRAPDGGQLAGKLHPGEGGEFALEAALEAVGHRPGSIVGGPGTWHDGAVHAEAFVAAAGSVGLRPGANAGRRVAVLLELWEQYGNVINLTGQAERSALWEHVLEGLQAVACAERVVTRGVWLDVGSGGGFPGLVAVACGWEVWLMEPRAKRYAFLELAHRRIGGSGGVVPAVFNPDTWREKLVNSLGERGKSAIQVVSARAVWAPHEWWKRGVEVVARDGVVLVHTHTTDPGVVGQDAVARVDGARWSVRAYAGRRAPGGVG